MNDPVHKVSLNQIADLSTIARSRIRSKLTRPHAKAVLLGEEEDYSNTNRINLVPKGEGAPRAHGVVNGVLVDVVLGGGCTSFIISLRFAKKIGITEIE